MGFGIWPRGGEAVGEVLLESHSWFWAGFQLALTPEPVLASDTEGEGGSSSSERDLVTDFTVGKVISNTANVPERLYESLM